MTLSDIHIPESLKNLKHEDYVYISILAVFFTLVGVTFFFSVDFLSYNINKVFTVETREPAHGLNMENYTLVAKKLGLSIPTEQERNLPQTSKASQATSATTVLDKQSLIIKVLNGTTKAGAASTLTKSLTNGGFSVLKTGNDDFLYSTTTIVIQESKVAYLPSLLAIVRKTYPDTYATTTKKTAAYDVVITIGGE